VSLPDALFRCGETAARRLRVSRRQLYATALAEFLDRARSDRGNEQLNQVYGDQPARVDPAFSAGPMRSLAKDS